MFAVIVKTNFVFSLCAQNAFKLVYALRLPIQLRATTAKLHSENPKTKSAFKLLHPHNNCRGKFAYNIEIPSICFCWKWKIFRFLFYKFHFTRFVKFSPSRKDFIKFTPRKIFVEVSSERQLDNELKQFYPAEAKQSRYFACGEKLTIRNYFAIEKARIAFHSATKLFKQN